MKEYKTFFGILFLGMLVLTSCSTQMEEDTHPYYRFTTTDNNLIVKFNYTFDQIITYENQLGEQLHFKVISNNTKKYGDYFESTFSGGGGILQSYYDCKIIKFQIIENQANFTEEQVSYIFSKSENVFKDGVKLPIWNTDDFAFFDEVDRPFNINLKNYNVITREQMNINGHLFDKVVSIQSGSTNSEPNALGALPNNVNKVFYDFDFGIIQFNDLDGNEWKVIYPQ